MDYNFRPIEGLWRFHLIYMIVMLIMAWSFFPIITYQSFLMVGLFAFVGLVSFAGKWQLVSHILAVVIGLVSPIIFFAQVGWWQTIVLILILSVIGFAVRKVLF